MTRPPSRPELDPFPLALKQATRRGYLSAAAASHIERWLQLPLDAKQAEVLRDHLRDQRWPDLEQAFWHVLPFGTAGRRGRMYPIGTATINERTIGESVQALANYVHRLHPDQPDLRAAVAFDCRHMSREFAQLSAEILLAAGFQVWMLGQIRSTPELAQTVRHFDCHCGVMITASHNPPADNAIKVFWSTGGQLLPPHDANITREIEQVGAIIREPLQLAEREQRVIYCQQEMDDVYRSAVLAQGYPGSRNVRILYSPLHGVGLTSVPPILTSDGFHDLHVYQPHATPDPDFPNVPGHIANPEDPAVLEPLVAAGAQRRADLVLASDPDADRIGCAAPLHPGAAEWQIFSGNQIGVLIAEYVLRRRKAAARLSPQHYVIRTIVSSAMLDAIAQFYGVRVIHDVLTGFKWIGDVIDRERPAEFVFGFEEAHGYLVGDHIRDKDSGVAALLLAQRAAESKTVGHTLAEDLNQLYRQFGCFQELSVSRQMPGADGMQRMQDLMRQLRSRPPASLAGMRVLTVLDYLTGVPLPRGSSTREPTTTPPAADLLVFQLEPSGYRVAVRPSGTEPKIKFYLFAWEPPDALTDLDAVKQALRDKLLLTFDDLMRACGLAWDMA